MDNNKVKYNLWDEKQEDTCGYCVFATVLPNGDDVICQKKQNLFEFSHTCNKFEFDILKKSVRRSKRPDFSRFSQDFFEL